jgi:iron complex outermembrane recepter protein
MGDVTVLQGYPDVDQAVAGAAGGTIAWATIDPSHDFGVDASLTGGSNNYQREFVRLQTGDVGPVRSWISYSHNETDVWRGKGGASVDKIDGKSVWQIDDKNSISASLQYNREIRHGGYETVSKAQIAQYGYDYNYTTEMASPTDTYFWRLHNNPFKNYMLSLDGEFQLTDSLHLSVVPYFQYGEGGSGTGYNFTESTSASNVGRFGYVNYDLNGDGEIGGSALTYAYSGSKTWRPGVIAKLAQDFGQNDTLTYGVWIDEPRQEQFQAYTPTANGVPADIWVGSNDNLITYPDSDVPQYNYKDYTKTTLRRVFVSNDWAPNDQWTVTVAGAYTDVKREGYGYQHYGSDGGPSYLQQYGGYSSETWKKFTPSAGVKFQINDANQLYLGYGRSFRAPVNGVITQSNAVTQYYQQNPEELAYSGITNEQLNAIGNNKPETADTVDLGWRYYADRLSASIDAYASNLKNKQVSGYDEASGQTVYLSVPALHQRGVNAEASFKLNDNFSLYASYAYTKSTITDNTDTIGDGVYPTKGKSFVDVPRNVAHLGVNFHYGPFWASLNGNYRSSYWADWVNTEKAPGYTTFNLNTGWDLKDFSTQIKKPQIKVNVYNLTDKQALTFASATNFLSTKNGAVDAETGDSLYASTSYYSLLAPRTVMVTFSASFF